MKEDHFKITIGVIRDDNTNPCTGITEESINFANYGSDNICIEIGNITYGIGLPQFEQIFKMVSEIRKKREDKLYEAEKVLTRVKACIELGAQNQLEVKDDKIIFKSDKNG